MRAGHLGVGAFLLVMLAGAPGPALAQSLTSIAVAADNDYFNFWRAPHERPDENYTHGARITFGFERLELTLGQRMFAPSRDAPTPIAGDRPYAGLLYLEAIGEVRDESRIRAVAFLIGVTGEASLAERVQRSFHEEFGFRKLRGWDHQLPFEIAFALSLEETQTHWTGKKSPAVVSVGSRWRGSIGTLETGAETQLWTRVDLAAGDGSPALYVRVGGGGAYVLRDLFLDGSTWSDSHSVDKNSWVGELMGALGVHLGPANIEYWVTHRTREFRTQARQHTFGTIALRLKGR